MLNYEIITVALQKSLGEKRMTVNTGALLNCLLIFCGYRINNAHIS
jgi:hypothetical protein